MTECYDCRVKKATKKHKTRDGMKVKLCAGCYKHWTDTGQKKRKFIFF